jgi:hypothetical protein
MFYNSFSSSITINIELGCFILCFSGAIILILCLMIAGTLLLLGLGMPRMKHAGFVGWLLMGVVLIVSSLGIIAH